MNQMSNCVVNVFPIPVPVHFTHFNCSQEEYRLHWFRFDGPVTREVCNARMTCQRVTSCGASYMSSPGNGYLQNILLYLASAGRANYFFIQGMGSWSEAYDEMAWYKIY